MLSTTSLSLTDPEKLKAAMTAAGMSSRKLATLTNLSQPRIQQLVAGHFPATKATQAVALAAALDVDVKDLFEFPDGEALIRLGLIRPV